MNRQTRQASGADRAVSQVLSVILMVALTTILSGMIGMFILNFTEPVDEEAQAGVTVEASGGAVSLSMTAAGNTVDIGYELEIDTGSPYSFEEANEKRELTGTIEEVANSSTYTVYGETSSEVSDEVRVEATVIGETEAGTETVIRQTTVDVVVREAGTF